MSNELSKYIESSLATTADTENFNKFLQAQKREQEFYAKVDQFNQALLSEAGGLGVDDVDKLSPVSHRFADGLYIREWECPPDVVTVTGIHNKSNPIFLLEGDVTLLTEHGADRLSPPWYTITKAGTQRIVYTHTKTKFVTVHNSDHLDADNMRNHLTFGSYKEIVKDFPEVEQIAKFIKCLEK